MQSSDMLPSELLLCDEDLCYLLVSQYLAIFLDGVVPDLIMLLERIHVSFQTLADLLVSLVFVQRLLKLHI